MFLDDQLISNPPRLFQQQNYGGSAQISGNFTVDAAKALAVQLNAGALPVPINLISQPQLEQAWEHSLLSRVSLQGQLAQ